MFDVPGMSLPSRGAWIEIPSHGLRQRIDPSLPSRGAWIEMINAPSLSFLESCRSPHGERGLKYGRSPCNQRRPRRSPHGERGLKYVSTSLMKFAGKSLPSRGAWIEIPWRAWDAIVVAVAPLTGSVD